LSAIPPNVIGSVLGTTFAQNQASHIRASDDAAKVSAERRQVNSVSELDSVVETGDNDTQVFTDSEGSGSQGREFTRPEPEPEPTPAAAPEDDGHIDFEA
jgi:hypothetical protein